MEDAMLKPLLFGLALLPAALMPAYAEETRPRVVLTTTLGTIELELDAEKAPITTRNFLQYVDKGHYDGLIFHRVIPGFMIQGGGFNAGMEQVETGEPIKNESGNGLSNLRGTIAMARTRDPDSATAQFFINTADNLRLDGRYGPSGYAVFGKVINGMETIDSISAVKTGRSGMHGDVPLTAVVIERAVRAEAEAEIETETHPGSERPES
jgi:cyclophilin family peptidyl-prolyl cis-trans isomerase